MRSKKEPSVFNLLTGKMTFTDEPLWYRILVMALFIGFWLTAVYFFRGWAVSAFTTAKISELKLSSLSNFFTGKSP